MILITTVCNRSCERQLSSLMTDFFIIALALNTGTPSKFDTTKF